MNIGHLTEHALTRMSQRGIRFDDLVLAELIGTEVEGGCLVRRRDVQAFVCELKKLETKLDGWKASEPSARATPLSRSIMPIGPKSDDCSAVPTNDPRAAIQVLPLSCFEPCPVATVASRRPALRCRDDRAGLEQAACVLGVR